MRQLPLLRLRASSLFANYFAGPNAAAVEWLHNLGNGTRPFVTWLYGVGATGKTHLLQALCARAGQRAETSAYLPLRQIGQDDPELLSGCEQLAWVCIDDWAAVSGRADWERALFRLYTGLEDSGGQLVIAACSSPLAADIHLPDLASRLSAGTVLRLQALDDEQQIAALQLRAAQRGLELPDDTISYLMRRLPRGMASMCGFLDALDEASLVAQRRLTVPFVRQVLAGHAQIPDEGKEQ